MAPLAADVSLCYLQLYRDLQWFQDVDRLVADAALAVLRRHTAYLRPETAVLSLASGAANADQRTVTPFPWASTVTNGSAKAESQLSG